MMRIVSEFKKLNKAVRAPNDANGCTARLSHVAADGRVAQASLVKLRTHQQNTRWYDAPSKGDQEHSRSQDQIE